MGRINIELLREASNELRQIKDGKGGLRASDRVDAMKALSIIHGLAMKLEAAEKEAGKVK
ncbi:hypothetical protein P7D66_16570 [Enterococcus avium]|uniref:hypothetical protein n=1 Tax=Enterococcus avium TaxID=33945 RepID=UPI00289091A4|nr:hypothetical protein [Enterococcus avium]MDT2423999.1 hypothetical protein [Enterococcus avium]